MRGRYAVDGVGGSAVPLPFSLYARGSGFRGAPQGQRQSAGLLVCAASPGVERLTGTFEINVIEAVGEALSAPPTGSRNRQRYPPERSQIRDDCVPRCDGHLDD
jgi:hypothetical protein